MRRYGCHLGPVRKHNNLQLTLTHSLSTAMATALAFALLVLLLLLVALLIIALLLVPETHKTVECRAKGGLVRGAYLSLVDELALPGC